MPSAIRALIFLVLTSILICGAFHGAVAQTPDDLGGDDIALKTEEYLSTSSFDIAENGDIYAAVQHDQATGHNGIQVFRSQDHGTTWDLWGALTTPSGQGDGFIDPFLQVVEGTVAKCFMTYVHTSNLFNPRIMMVSSYLSDVVADFSSPVTVMSTPSMNYAWPRFDTDVSSYGNFYIYLVAQRGPSGHDIYFTRSTDQGASFETPYAIGPLVPTDRDYRRPDVSYGFGGYINVVWDFTSNDGSFDAALRYNYTSNWGSGGLADWGGVHGLGSTSDGIDDRYARIEASATGTEVVIACERRTFAKDARDPSDPGIYVSTDHGFTFPTSTAIPGGVKYVGDIQEQPGTGNWFLGGTKSDFTGIHRANVADLTTWTPLETFVDQQYADYFDFKPSLAFNPAQGYRPALLWNYFDWSEDEVLYFDGEWRRDEGYPNLEPGFPVDLSDEPRSAPAVVDLNGDGDLEIVFGDNSGYIQVFQSDGTPLPGWPVSIGESLSTSPVAIGDLRGNGDMLVVVGSENGNVHCFDAQGQVAPGDWPYESGMGSPAFVAIGAFGQGPYTRGIVVSVGVHGSFLDHTGGFYPGAVSRILARLATFAPALGDVNGDGLVDVAFAHEEVIAVATIMSSEVIFGNYMPAQLSGSPTLGDFDLDGNYEVVVPLDDGTLQVLNEDGSSFPGFPFTGSTGSPLSTAAIAQCLGTHEPEICTAGEHGVVHLVKWDGAESIPYPETTGGWNNYGSPIITRIQSTSSDVAMGSRGQKAWAWSNLGGVIDGWPKASDQNFYVAPASGDIDLDGINEIVLISSHQLMVVDVNNTPNAAHYTWAMAGHDPQRTGCADCPEDLVTPVEDNLDTITRVSFAQPSPNPSSGSATFRFAVPGPAVVNLEIFDVRGHRVSLVTREEVGMGHHVVSWGGLSDQGSPLASGLYFARLRVQGPGINEEVTRKITLAR